MRIVTEVAGVSGATGELVVGAVLGAGVGLVAALVGLAVVRRQAKISPVWAAFGKKAWIPLLVAGLLLGAWVGYTLATPETPPDWYDDVHHGLLLLVIASSAWFWYSALGMLSDKSILVNATTGRDVRRFRTQAQVLRRVGKVTVIVLAIALGLLTFPETRAPVLSLFASAGLLSVVAGLAAQTTLANMFAGLQLAFTDAIRVGDTVVIDDQDQPGSVEEITLTYVVVRIWDERRIVLPSTEFTTKPFENWTRSRTRQLVGTNIQLDWSAPVAEIRAEVGRLVEESPLWDGRTWSVQVFNLDAHYLELRILVSSENWASAWDLRSYVRENIVAWIWENAPQAVPRTLMQFTDRPVGRHLGTEEVDQTALKGPSYVGPAGGGDVKKRDLMKADPDQIAADEVKFARKERKAKRKALSKKKPKLLGKFLFSGTPEGHERAHIYDGPGEQVRERRDEAVKRQQEIAKKPLTES